MPLTCTQIDVNVLGVIRTINAFLPLLKETSKTHDARVITISSGAGDLDGVLSFQLGMQAPYAISKAAVNMVVVKYAATFADQPFIFLGISPGLVDTSVHERECCLSSL